MTDRYVVAGNPIAHSRSPFIHEQFARETGQDIVYDRQLCADEDAFAEWVRAFQAAGGRGLNVTVPFKEVAFALATRRTQRAELAGAVNTLWFEPDGAIGGDNTDGIGLVRDLEVNNQVSITDARVLILGAGGAARGAGFSLLARRPSALTIANRTVERAVALAGELEAFAANRTLDGERPRDPPSPSRAETTVAGIGYGDFVGREYDLVVNATAAGLAGAAPPVPVTILRPGGCCYDMSYGAAAAPFGQWARVAGAGKLIDGVGMLVEQAAAAFEIWRGVAPATAPVIAKLRASLGA